MNFPRRKDELKNYPMFVVQERPGLWTWSFAKDSTAHCLAYATYPHLAESIDREMEIQHAPSI